MQALQQALNCRQVLEAGHGKSLAALSRDLFDAGFQTSAGRPLTPEMVRRMRSRLEEAKLALADGELDEESCEWRPADEIKGAILARNAVALRWFLKMARKELGDAFADRLLLKWLRTEHAPWIQGVLADSAPSKASQAQHTL
jgi:hypothetical protein